MALARINAYKKEFLKYKSTPHFNFLKWHVITYIILDIQHFSALDGLYTGINSKAHYINIVKNFYNCINKRADYLR